MKINYKIKEIVYIPLSKLKIGDIVTVVNTDQLEKEKRDWCEIDSLKKEISMKLKIKEGILTEI